MSGAVGTGISLVIVGAIIGAYKSDLINHKSAGWAGIAFIYIYDINFSYSFGGFPLSLLSSSFFSVSFFLTIFGLRKYPKKKKKKKDKINDKKKGYLTSYNSANRMGPAL